MDYLSDKLTEEQLFKLTFDKGKSNDSVQVLKSALSNFEYFTQDQFKKTRLQVLDDLSNEFKKNRDTRAPLILLHRFREWISEDHLEIRTVSGNGAGRPLKAKRGKSQKDYLSQVKKWMRHCGGIKIDIDDYRDFVSIPNSAMEEEDEAQPLTRDELKEIILHTMNPVRRSKFYFMKCTAARHLETLRVKKKYIDFSKDPVMVRLPKHIVKGKTRTRIVYLDKEASSKVEDICNRLSDDDYVFMPNDAIDTNFRNNENRWWGNMMAKLHLDQKGENGHLKKRIHSIRSFAMKAVEKGNNDSVIADAYGGHKKFVGKYLDKTDEERNEIFKKSEPYMSLFSEIVTVDNEEIKEQYQKQMDIMQKQIDDLKYGLTGRMNMYNEQLAPLDISSTHYLANSLLSLMIELGLSEEQKVTMMKEFEQAKKENREPDLRKAWNQPRLTQEQVKEMRVLLNNYRHTGSKKQASQSNHRLTRYRGSEYLKLLLSEYE